MSTLLCRAKDVRKVEFRNVHSVKFAGPRVELKNPEQRQEKRRFASTGSPHNTNLHSGSTYMFKSNQTTKQTTHKPTINKPETKRKMTKCIHATCNMGRNILHIAGKMLQTFVRNSKFTTFSPPLISTDNPCSTGLRSARYRATAFSYTIAPDAGQPFKSGFVLSVSPSNFSKSICGVGCVVV